jgi:membrane fusion protein, multidrug efflux system
MNALADVAVDAPSPVGGRLARPTRHRAVTTRHLLIGGGGLLALLAILAWGAHWYTVSRFIQSTDDAFVGGDITVLAPKVPGFIATVAVTDNQSVHAGDLLVRLDDRDFKAALDRAQAAVAAQQARLANLAATRHLQQAVIAEARASITAADAEVVRTRDDEARFARLAQRGAASVQSSQKAISDFAQSQALALKARAGLDAAERQSEVIDTERQQTEAQLAQAIADRDLAQLNLRYTELRAPIDGVIGNRSAQVGAYAAVGTQLLSVVPAQGLWVDANFKEDQLAHMHAGQQVTIHADVLPDVVFHGEVTSLSPATGAQFSVLPAENATGNFTRIVQRVPVRIALLGDASHLGRLRPGLSVQVDVDQRHSTQP